MTIFRNKVNKKLYIIEHLVHDIKHLNRNAFAGIYCTPYFKGQGHAFRMLSKDHDRCYQFVRDNFSAVSVR